MAEAATDPKPVKKSKAYVLLVALLAVCLVGTAAYLYLTRPKASKQQTDAILDNLSGDEQTAIAELQKAYQDAATKEGKASAAYYLASRYAVAEQHEQALSYFKEANKFYKDKDANILLGIASESAALKKDSQAKDYYQKALDLYKAEQDNGADNAVIIAELEDKIRSLTD